MKHRSPTLRPALSLAPGKAAAVVVATLATGAVALLAQPATAQVTPGQRSHPAVERYNRTAKGANVEEWKRRLGDEDVKKRLEAVDSLGQKGGEEGIKPLIEAMADSDYRVRTRAVDYLGMLRATEATPNLMQSLFLSSVGKDEKLRALTALGRIGDPTTTDRLIAYAATIQDDDLASRAVFAVGEIGRPDTRERIAALKGTRSDPDFDRLVDDALGKIDLSAQYKPVEQPTLLELEKKLAPPQQQQGGQPPQGR